MEAGVTDKLWSLDDMGGSWTNGKQLAINYDDQWRDLRKRGRLFWFVFLGWVPAELLILNTLDSISPGLGNRAFLWVGGLFMVAFFAAGIYRDRFRCPRCGEFYFF